MQERICLADFGLACPMDALEDAPQAALGILAAIKIHKCDRSVDSTAFSIPDRTSGYTTSRNQIKSDWAMASPKSARQK